MAKIADIARLSEIDRPNIYRLIRDLEKLELIETIIGKHPTYRSIPLEIGISVLLNKKKLEFNETVSALEKLAKTTNRFYSKQTETYEDDYFKIYPAGSQVFCNRWQNTLKKVKESVDVIATEHREPKDDPIWDIYDSLLQKGVKVRWIIDRSQRNDQEFSFRVKQFQHLFVYPSIEMRICFDCVQPFGAICDNKLAIIFLCKKPPVKVAKSFWTNNEQIRQNFREHFEINWEKARPYPVEIEA